MRRLDTKSLKFKLWKYFIFFATLIMGVLWLFQIVFLKYFYEGMKTGEVKKIGDEIISDYANGDQDNIKSLSFRNGFVIQIFDESGAPQFTTNLFGDMRPPHTDSDTLTTLKEKLAQSKDGKVTYIREDQPGQTPGLRFGGKGDGRALVYGAVLPAKSGNSGKMYLYISTQIAPVDATTAVLQTQLLIVTGIALLLSLLISLLIATRLAKPITKITKSASELAKGNYDVRFEPANYTEINQLADTLNFATTELSKTEELRRELIANISHDLRTPLTMVKMYAELIRDVSGDKPEKREAHTTVIIEEADRLSALITDLLDLSKLQSGTAQLNLTSFDLGEKAEVILNRFTALAEKEGYHFNVDCDEGAMITADEQRIDQVIYNLVSNAVNYTGEDKMVSIHVKKQGDRVRFEVSDTGNGIPPDKLGQIWERYYKAKETHKRAVVGSGLGLSIVKGILDSHKAAYGVDSTMGKGSTFWFEL